MNGAAIRKVSRALLLSIRDEIRRDDHPEQDRGFVTEQRARIEHQRQRQARAMIDLCD